MYRMILTYVLLFLVCICTPIEICHSQSVSATINGQVTDKQNNPLSDYTISAVSQTDNITYAVKTNSGGRFSLTNLPIGTCELEIRHFSTLLAQREVTITENTIVEADFVINGRGVISGFLLDTANNLPLPISGEIKVGILVDSEDTIGDVYSGNVTNGYFEVKNLLSGRYVIIDSFDGYVFAESDSPVVMVYPGSHIGGVDLLLKTGASLSGVYVDAENGSTISDVALNVTSEKKDTIYVQSTHTYHTKTNNNGNFHLSIPNDPETYSAFTLIASHPRYQTQQWRWDMSPDKNDYELGHLELKPFFSLQGSVSKSTDGLHVYLKMHNKPSNFFRAGAQPEHTVYTDTNGNFLFSELHPIDYSLTILQNDVIIAFLDSVNPQRIKPLKIRLPKLKILHGKVVDTRHHPIADANIYAVRRSENPYGHGAILSQTQSDTNGLFQMQLLETKPHLLSIEVTKSGYLTSVYPKVEIGNEPLQISLQQGFAIKGRVILPPDVASEGFYEVKVFPENTEMEHTLNPMSLYKPVKSKRFPVTETTFVLDGLFEETYTLYIVGDGIAATSIVVKASMNDEEALIVADEPTVVLYGQVLWSDTGEPAQNVLVSRSWYPWELSQYDMSITLDRFETETDREGKFVFSNLTQTGYNLHIRAVNSVYNKETQKFMRKYLQKQVTIPICPDNIQHIYLGRSDGTPFVKK
ncbi:MAG: carboxypeptidase-like regulatory domain-containing protein [Candidatus Poribacteria bacterium]|nr:carboxypeptidase-like regulatory domain-containing protein [Candidatus Poribacteria bacterium]